MHFHFSLSNFILAKTGFSLTFPYGPNLFFRYVDDLAQARERGATGCGGRCVARSPALYNNQELSTKFEESGDYSRSSRYAE